MKSLFAALRFLSILPVPSSWTGRVSDIAGSVKFFPIVGLIMGAIAAAFAWLSAFIVPQIIVAAVVVILLAILTRGLHLDGVADTADGFWSVSDRQRTLEIMKDSNTGAMGVIAIVCVLLLKFACLSTLGTDTMWRVVLLMVLVGRCMMTLPISIFPYARKEGGLGQLFYETRTVLNAIWAILVVLLAGGLLVGWAGIAASLAAVLSAMGFGFYCKWKIGGVTGDTIGATCEITEVVTALAVCVCYGKLVVSV